MAYRINSGREQARQLPLMSRHGFTSFLKLREIDIGEKDVQALVDNRVIVPLNETLLYFHPFHVWPAQRIVRSMSVDITAAMRLHGLDVTRIEDYLKTRTTSINELIQAVNESYSYRTFNQELLALLLELEPYYLPLIRKQVRGILPGEWQEWRDSVDPTQWLSLSALSREDIVAWRRRLLFDALLHDPAPDHYLLLRSIPFAKRDKFKGSLRIAYDLYEIAEVLRLFLEEVFQAPAIKEWDPVGDAHTSWVERLYGSQPGFGKVDFLRPLARNYGLDPAVRVLWLVEGPTEEAFILRYAERLGVDVEQFIRLDHAGGDGALLKSDKWITPRLDSAQRDQCFVTLTFDESEEARRQATILATGKRVNLPYVLCAPDFERENFSVEQLTTVAGNWVAESSSAQIPAAITSTIERRLNERQEDFVHAFNSVLSRNEIPSFIHKGTEWGNRLADYLSDQREQEYLQGTYLEERLSKIERQVFSILRNSEPYIDYPRSIEKLSPSNLEIMPVDVS